MLKRRNRKGFTLAELLIVVAIIAILIAIAVPMFVGSLTRAQKATLDANKRTARAAVVMAILNDQTYDIETKFTSGTAVYFEVAVNPTTGEIGTITEKGSTGSETTSYADWQKNGKLTISITRTDLKFTTTNVDPKP